jgi:hypothetical protein
MSGERLAEAFADPPHETTWEVTTGERIEVHDEAGAVFAWTKPNGGSIKDPNGRLLVTFVPGAKQMFSVSNVIGSAISGILGSEPPPWRPGGSPEAPPLNLRYVPASLPFAQLQLQADGTSRVELLPPGRLNDKVIGRSISTAVVERIRARSPLLYRRTPMNLPELSDPKSCVLARMHHGNDDSGESTGSNWLIEVLDNDLPSVWLFAILIACYRWHR